MVSEPHAADRDHKQTPPDRRKNSTRPPFYGIRGDGSEQVPGCFQGPVLKLLLRRVLEPVWALLVAALRITEYPRSNYRRKQPVVVAKPT